MYGNGRRATSSPIPVLLPALTKNIPSPGLGITRCSAAVVGRLVHISFTTLIGTFTHRIGATYGPGSAPVPYSLKKNEDWNSYAGTSGLTLRKPDHCASLGENSERTWQPRIRFTSLRW